MVENAPPLRIAQLDYGWEVTFHSRNGTLLHISHCNSEIAALRAANFIAGHYGYEGPVLLETRSARQQISLERIMATQAQPGKAS